MKLTAYQCWKEKEKKNLTDEDYKKLLIENGVILSASEDLDDSLFHNMKSSVLGCMLRKGIDEITENCVLIAKDYSKKQNDQLLKDCDAYKNRIRVLQNLNTKYREKLGISNEPIDALGLISPLED